MRRVKTPSVLRVIAAALCALALWAGTAGAAQFLCNCGGKVVTTQTSHCYGPHGAGCHEDDAHGHAPSGDRKDHQALVQDARFFAPPSLATSSPPPLLAILTAVDDAFPRGGRCDGSWRRAADPGGSPPVGVAIAATIVLLI